MAFGKLNFKFTWKCREHFTLLSLASAFAIYILSSITRSSSHRCQIQSTHEREHFYGIHICLLTPYEEYTRWSFTSCCVGWNGINLKFLFCWLFCCFCVWSTISSFIFITSTYRSAAHLIVKSISLLFCNIASADVLLCKRESEIT